MGAGQLEDESEKKETKMYQKISEEIKQDYYQVIGKFF